MVRLESENERLRGQVDQTLPKVDEKIQEVSQALEGLDKAARRTDADTGVLVQKNIEDVAALRGELEAANYKISELRAALDAVEANTEKRMLAMMSPEAAKSYEARKKLEDIERPAEPKAFLELARERAKAGDTIVARRLYDEFFKKFPGSSLVGEAHFGLGELWFGEDKCREALFEYGKVIQNHPKTSSAPQAYLRSSECFSKLKMNEEARLALQEVVKNHPKSEAAKTAKAKLAQMDAKKPAPKKRGK